MTSQLELTQELLEASAATAQAQAIELASLKMELAKVKAQLKNESVMKDAYKAEFEVYFNEFHNK